MYLDYNFLLVHNKTKSFSKLVSKIRGGNIKSLTKTFFWIVLSGVIFFFGILTYFILQREKEIILNIYKEKTSQTVNLITNDLVFMMTESKPAAIIENIKAFNREQGLKIGVVGGNGLPAFDTHITVPREIFDAQKDHYITSDSEFIFFKPLANENRCHGCHSAEDKTRGMLVIKTSIKEAQKEIEKTAQRLVVFAIFLGLASELFLITALRKIVLGPLKKLSHGSTLLKNGMLEHRIELNRKDEIGALAESFNQMAESIENSHLHLEETVNQKTNELRVIAQLAGKVFKGDITLNSILDHCVEIITEKMGFDYSVLCFIEKESGLLTNEIKRGDTMGFCKLGISLESDHPFAISIREASPTIKGSSDLQISGEFNNIAIVPIISHQRKRCREVNICTLEACPAFNSPEERCWMIEDTLCRSPQAVAGEEKIFGCIHCTVFPVLGVLVAGRRGEITSSTLNSLEILASQIASAVENQRLIEAKKEDISKLIKLNDISVESLQALGDTIPGTIVSSSTALSNTDASVLWLEGDDGRLKKAGFFNLEDQYIPESLSIEDSFVGTAIREDRCIETTNMKNAGCFKELIDQYGFLYASSIPLKIRDSAFGCITLFKKKDFFMTDSEKAIILLFASHASAAINTSKLYKTLFASNEFSDAIFNSTASGVMVLDKEGHVLKINLIGSEILRISQSEIIGEKITDIYPEIKDMLLFESALGREVTITLPDGTSLPVGFTNSPLYHSSEAREGTVILFRDLTEIKKLQTELKKKEHFETVSMIISGVAHEVRNPLFGITSIGQILEKEIELPQHKALTQAMLKEAGRMKRLIDELLLYTKPTNLVIKDVEANILFKEIQNHVSVKRADISLVLNIAPFITLKVDTDKIRQVFLNLLNNSIDAAKSSITVSARPIDGFIEIIISDDGAGIRKEHLEKVFDPFFTTKKGGTGLGLPICRKIIEDHEGSVNITSSEEKGTTVTLLLKA